MCLRLFCLLALVVLMIFAPDGAAEMEEDNREKGIIVIGAIVDNSSRVGKEQRVAMEMAVHDFNEYSSDQSSLVDLRLRNSGREPVHAALAAMDLINSQVQAILGPQTWEETSLVAEIAGQNQTPILSFADTIPKWAAERFPFLLEASPNQQHHGQMKAIAAVVQSWEWHQVTIVYEDIDSSTTGIFPHLSDALREVGAEIAQVLALPPFISPTLTEELENLRRSQCRVFIVHLSLPLAKQFFEKAKNMNMMEKDYVWITTDSFTSLAHSINASRISSSMEGIVGVKSYISEKNQKFQDFYSRFRKKFGLENPEEDNHEPGALAVQAYDAVWSVACAISEKKPGNQTLLERISLTDFDGLLCNGRFMNNNTTPQVYQIINLTGRSYRELGFWTDGLGFSKTIDDSATYNSSMNYLGHVFWPGSPWNTPRGWATPTDSKPLRIGVPVTSVFKQYVSFEFDEVRNITFSGFSIELFKATVSKLPFYLAYEFLPFNGSYNDLVKQIYLKEFDAVVGDVAIVARRYEYAEFTHPYSEPGLVMIVPLEKSANKALLFMKPFTKGMWIIIGTVCIYNGLVVWLIERKHRHELQAASALHQTGAFLWLSFSSLFSLQGGTLHSNLSRMTMVVWLFVALVITQTYTANLASMLTLQGLKPATANLESLQSSNALVGHSNVSFVASYLVDVLRFNRKNLKGYTSVEDYAEELKTRKISAIFLEVALSKIFLARYCKSFAAVGPTYKTGGFGFAFPKGSPLLPSVTEALLNVSESGKLRELETNMIRSETCIEVDVDGEGDHISSLSPSSFWVLFAFSGGTSTIALLLYVSHRNWKLNEYLLVHETVRMLALALMKQWGTQKQRFSERLLSHGGSPRSSTTNLPEMMVGSSVSNEVMPLNGAIRS